MMGQSCGKTTQIAAGSSVGTFVLAPTENGSLYFRYLLPAQRNYSEFLANLRPPY